MRTQRFALVLTVINLAILLVTLAHERPATAGDIAPMLRGRSLEIIDEQGRVRASIKLHPADPGFKMPDGRIGYPETVMLRLVDANGRPEVKLGASEEGGGLGLVGSSDSTNIILEANGPESSLKLARSDGRTNVIRPQ
jgi:hypothetical protein